MKIKIAIVLLITIVFSFILVANSYSLNDLAESIVLVVEDKDYKPNCSTGFVVGEDRESFYIMTTVFAVDNDADSLIIWRDNTTYEEAEIIYKFNRNFDDYDEGFGVVIAKTKDKKMSLKPLILNDKDVSNNITAVGFTGSRYFAKDDATVDELWKKRLDIKNKDIESGVEIYFVKEEFSERFTGSPVFNDKDKVTGLFWSEGNTDGFIEMSQILALLDRENVPYKTSRFNYLIIIAFAFLSAVVIALIILKKRNAKGLTLICLNGVFKSKKIELEKSSIIFGRDPSQCNIVYPADMDLISRKHCEIYYDSIKKSYVLIDYSTRGTFWSNGERLVKNTPYVLNRGSSFYIVNESQLFELS